MTSYSDDDIDIDNMDFLPDDFPPSASALPQSAPPPAAYVQDAADDMEQASFIRPLHSGLPNQPTPAIPHHLAANLKQEMKRWLCLYPIYFDAAVSSRRGRRVPASIAFERPTVWHIAKALERLRFPGIVESEKTHPADPLNPGRVRTLIWDKDSRTYVSLTVANRRQLFKKIAQLLPDVQDDVDALLADRARQQQRELEAMQAQFAKMGMGGLPMPSLPGLPGMPGMDAFAGLLGGSDATAADSTTPGPSSDAATSSVKSGAGAGKAKGKAKSGGASGGKKGKK
ncbi:signal recognition particle, SRP19 subunit [Catenaria anguillulae PL171]|uniref:Signal recognition particle, SRP19 subunit n=1 Tax=Catenaria anguillulae PL171 TaxID=765915 RepID=A0A1Y2GZE7_9FUNG|nr:signal recognition particle, SRP19 subunit [Catenaria anguillulae PL171]